MLYSTYLFRRGDTFYYRAKVPIELKNQLKRREIWISLRTSDRNKAELRLAQRPMHSNIELMTVCAKGYRRRHGEDL